MDACKSCGRILIDLREEFDSVDRSLLLNKLLLFGLSSLALIGISPLTRYQEEVVQHQVLKEQLPHNAID